MKNTLYDIHLSIYKYLRKKAQSFDSKPSKLLLEYQKDQTKSSKREFSNSSIGELMNSIENSDIIYLGDFHTFDQSTRNLERLMRILTSKRHDFAIALEFVHTKHQDYIDHFLKGHITELEFLESINYKESWRFPWTYYRRFFEIAKKEKIPIIALNTLGSLKARDERASRVIAKFYKKNPERKILVLFGEYHIVPNKLPERVMISTKKEIIHTIIHQNLDEVYWQLAKTVKSISDKVVKFSNHEFVLITSSPWLKYESQIYWYEHSSEDPDFDIHEYLIETGALNFSENVPENFTFICDEIIKTLDLTLPRRDVEDFHLYDHIKLDYIQNEVEKVEDPKLRSYYYELIERGRSFKLPYSTKYFCPSYSINRISYLAGIHLFHINLKSKKVLLEKLLNIKNKDEFFFYLIKQCMMGYFASKLINPHRKCDLYLDYKKMIRSKKTTIKKKELYKICLKITDTSSFNGTTIKSLPLKDLHLAARITGHMYADILFDHIYSKTKDFNEALKLILASDFDADNFEALKKIILGNFNYQKMSKRIF